MLNVGQYRLVLRNDITADRLVVCRTITEHAARVWACKISAALPPGCAVEVLIGRGRSTSLLYTFKSSAEVES